MTYSHYELPRPIPLVWDRRKVRNERLRFSLTTLVTVLAIGLLFVEAFDTEAVVSYVASLWAALPHWPIAPPAH